MKKKSLYLILILILLLNVVVVYADGDNLNNELDETNQKVDKLDKEINENKKKIKDVNKQIEGLDVQITDISSELEQIQNQLVSLNNQIVVTKNELVEAEEKIGEKNDTLSARLRTMYKNGNVGYLEVLLGSADIKDFFTRLDMVQCIADQDVELLKDLKIQRDDIESKKDLLEVQQSSVLMTKKKIETKKSDLIVASRAKENMMRDLEKDTKAMEKQYDEQVKLADELVERIRRSQRSSAEFNGQMMWPVPGYTRISSYFGYRIHPIFKIKKMHTGIDIPAPTGTPIKAAADGVVSFAGVLGGYGNTIMIDHNGGITTLYGHNSVLVVKEGQSVSAGDTIAKAGSTGNSTGPHCHFEVRTNGKYEDPIPWVK